MKKSALSILQAGGIGVLPTDTIYGLVGSALNKKTIKRIYAVKKRNPNKPCIILISSLKDLAKFNIKPNKETLNILNKFWPGKVSIIINGIAFRLPASPRTGGLNNKNLIEILKQTGPLIAPSANPEGLPPAKTIAEAKAYFGNQVDFYVAGRSNKKPSKLIKIENGAIEVLRK